MKQRFREDTTGTLRASPQEGPPITAATIELFKPDGSVLQASDTATLPTVSTSTGAAAGEPVGEKSINVSSTTGIVPGGKYWLGTVGEDSLQQVVATKVVSPTVFEIAEGLTHRLEEGDSVLGSELTYTLTTTHTADRDENYRAVWTYTVGTQTYTASQLFDVVAWVFALALGPTMLRRHIPDSVRRQAPGVTLQDAVLESEAKIMRELRRNQFRPDRVRDMDQFTWLGVLGVKEQYQERQSMIDPDILPTLEDTRSQWRMEFDRIMASGLSWYDQDEDLSVDSTGDSLSEIGEEGTVRALYAVLG